MIILDNIIFSLQKNGGISVYWSELIKNLLSQDNEVRFIEQSELAKKNIFRKKIEIDNGKILKKNNRMTNLKRYLPIQIPLGNKEDNFYIFHSSYYRFPLKKGFNNIKIFQIVTLHDFTYEKYSKGLKKYIHSYQKYLALRMSDVIICISQNTKKDLLLFYPSLSKKRIEVIYNGASTDYYRISSESYDYINYVLFIGSRANYKNFNFAVSCIERTKDLKLYIVGPKLSLEEEKILNKSLGDRWKIFENIESSYLNKLYNDAFALFYPSSYEGFGIPVLEAMKCGCPVIALNESSIPELIPMNEQMMTNITFSEFERVKNLIFQKREIIIREQLLKSEEFSWGKCMSEVLKVYKSCNK